MDLKDILLFITSVASIVGVLFSIIYQAKNYSILKTKENENELFKLRLNNCESILGELDTLLHFIQLQIWDKEMINKTQKERGKIADQINDRCFAFDNLVVRKSLYLSENILDSLDDIVIKLYGTDGDDLNFEDSEKYHDELLGMANRLNEIMRDDLQLDKLNQKLYKRSTDRKWFL